MSESQNSVSAEDLARVERKIDKLVAHVEDLHASQQMLASLYQDMVPIATTAIDAASERLAEFEARGYFDFAREATHVLDNIVGGYTPDDVHALAENIVGILNAVRRVTQPEVLEFAEHTAEAMEDTAEQKPKGVITMMRSSAKDEDVRRGMAVALEALRQIGKAAAGEKSDDGHKVSPLLGAKRNLRSTPAAAKPAAARPAPARASEPAPAAPVDAIEAGGLPLDANGFLADTSQWTEDFARAMAGSVGIELRERHWVVLKFLREEFASTGASPNIRRITIGSGVQTKELFELFPRAPAKTAARIAGVPKPVGCV